MTSLLMVVRITNGEREAEPVVVDRIGDQVSLTLGDGQVLTFSLLEFLHCAGKEGLRDAA